MKNQFRIVLVLLIGVFSSLSGEAGSADSIYLNGRIYTANDSQKWAESVVIKDGVFVFVGNDAAASKHIGPQTKRVNLGGKMVMPGIHDAHSHMLWGGLNRLFECRLPPGTAIDKLIIELKECQQGL